MRVEVPAEGGHPVTVEQEHELRAGLNTLKYLRDQRVIDGRTWRLWAARLIYAKTETDDE